MFSSNTHTAQPLLSTHRPPLQGITGLRFPATPDSYKTQQSSLCLQFLMLLITAQVNHQLLS